MKKISNELQSRHHFAENKPFFTKHLLLKTYEKKYQTNCKADITLLQINMNMKTFQIKKNIKRIAKQESLYWKKRFYNQNM